MAHGPRASRIPIIGVTGSIGAGKSSVSACFRRWGAVIVSGDEIGRFVVDQSTQLRRQLARTFGADILRGGRIDRDRLARRAFGATASTAMLNRLVHPPLVRELNRRVRIALRSPRARAVIIDAALLAEWGHELVEWDYLVGVWAPPDVRIRRLRAHGVRDSRIRAITRAQMPWRIKRIRCDAVITNDSSLAVLRRRARLCWENLLLSHRQRENAATRTKR